MAKTMMVMTSAPKYRLRSLRERFQEDIDSLIHRCLTMDTYGEHGQFTESAGDVRDGLRESIKKHRKDAIFYQEQCEWYERRPPEFSNPQGVAHYSAKAEKERATVAWLVAMRDDITSALSEWRVQDRAHMKTLKRVVDLIKEAEERRNR